MGIKLGPIDIGDTKNSILNFDPLTNDIGEGLAKTGGDIVEGIQKTGGDIIEGIGKTADDVVSGVEKTLGDLAEGVNKTAGDLGEIARNPIVRAIVSVAYPPAAPYLNAYAAAYDGKITLEEAVSFATAVGTDVGFTDIDPNVVKAIETGAKVADGASPLEALAGSYGADFAKELGLDKVVKDNIKTTFGEDAYDFLDERMDIDQAAADYVAGDSAERILGNQFGDEIVGYVASDDPSMQALGYAGIEGVVSKAEGLSNDDALLNSAQTYYDRGGQLPKFDLLGNVTGISDFGVDINDFIGKIDIPTIDLLGNYSIPELNTDFGVDLGKLDWEGVEFDSLDMGLGEAADFGVDVGKLNLEGIPLPAIGLTAQLALQQEGGVGLPQDDEEEDILSPKRSTDNPLLQEENTPLSKAVLGTKL
jgi:hypothetical protein